MRNERMDSSQPRATDTLANERTFLAYARTALAFIAFGFVIARFALFTRQIAVFAHIKKTAPEISIGFGISGQLSVGDDGQYLPGTPRDEAARAFDLRSVAVSERRSFTLARSDEDPNSTTDRIGGATFTLDPVTDTNSDVP